MAVSLQERALASVGGSLSGGLYSLSSRFSWGGHGIFGAERISVKRPRNRHTEAPPRRPRSASTPGWTARAPTVERRPLALWRLDAGPTLGSHPHEAPGPCTLGGRHHPRQASGPAWRHRARQRP